MFGGLTFMVKGNMCCGVVKEELMLRVGADAMKKSLLSHIRVRRTSPANAWLALSLLGKKGSNLKLTSLRGSKEARTSFRPCQRNSAAAF